MSCVGDPRPQNVFHPVPHRCDADAEIVDLAVVISTLFACEETEGFFAVRRQPRSRPAPAPPGSARRLRRGGEGRDTVCAERRRPDGTAQAAAALPPDYSRPAPIGCAAMALRAMAYRSAPFAQTGVSKWRDNPTAPPRRRNTQSAARKPLPTSGSLNLSSPTTGSRLTR